MQLEERREQDPHISLSNLTSTLDERKPKFERSSSVESDRSPLLLHHRQEQQQVKPPSRPSSAMGGGGEGRKFSLPANINQHLMSTMDREAEDAIGAIQDTIEGHATRSKSLSILRTSGGRIHIARPWLKKKASADSVAGVTEESSGRSGKWGI